MSIITHIYSGLGNQLFQYAAARSIALKCGTTLKLDTSDYATDPLTSFDLNKFCIQASIASPDETIFYKQQPKGLLQQLKFLQWRLQRPVLIKEQAFHFKNELATATKNTYITGHWQSEKYFLDIRPYLLTELEAKEKDTRRDLIQKTKATNSVAIVIRRGDFLKYDHLNLYGDNLSYYYQAIEKLKLQISDPHFFIFSDDIDWVKAHLVVSEPVTYVSRQYPSKNGYVVNPERHLDLMLMKACKHQIICNSTYAWWGAWLNSYEHKIVIAPRHWSKPGHKWTNGKVIKQDDLLPETWIQL